MRPWAVSYSENGDAMGMGRANWRSSFLDDPGRTFFVENWGSAHRKIKVAKTKAGKACGN
jgi:hypothetical protein